MDTIQENLNWLSIGLPESNSDTADQLQRFFIRKHVLDAHEHAAKEPEFATPRLSKWFRSNRQLGSKDRRRVSDIVYDLIRHGRVLKRFGATSTQEMLDVWIAFHRGEAFEASANDADIDFADALGLPIEIARQWMDRWKSTECIALAQAVNRRPTTFLRVNAVKGKTDRIVDDLAKEKIRVSPVSHTPGALKLLGRGNVIGSSAFRAGKIEVQDISSQQFCAALPVESGMVVWDMCAGAGGKALALAAQGTKVFATDPRKKALDSLLSRAKRAGVKIEIKRPQKADLVVIDAPCSGLGRLHREPALRWRFDSQNPWRHQQTQTELIEKALNFVQPGGYIAYATCSLLAEENTHEIPGKVVEERWLWPHVNNGDGFYWRIVCV